MTLTSTHFGNLRVIYYRLNDAIAGSVIVLYAAAGIAHDTKSGVNNQLSRL
jgi:methyl coenzyme M reductase subunit C